MSERLTPKILLANGAKREGKIIRRDLTEDELHALRDRFAVTMMKVSDEEENFKSAKLAYKSTFDGLKEEADRDLRQIRAKYVDRLVDCLALAVFERNEMVYYDAETCEEVFARPLWPQEMQVNIIYPEAVSNA